ncbi:MAG TPA: universal stress protein [Longimicrobium sp.]|nr:universal stress protein [Longimicrobium sp.]
MTTHANGSHVLVATDFSPCSAAAYTAAADIARRLDAPVRVLHVSDARSVLQQGDSEEWLRSVGVAGDELVTCEGVPWLEILRCSEDLPAALVVVGIKGQSASSIQVPGSTTLALLRYSRVPVMVVPAPVSG